MRYKDAAKRVVVVGLVLAMTCLWLVELTKRRAREAADQFLGPVTEMLGWSHTIFSPVPQRAPAGRLGLRWWVYYDHRYQFADTVVIEVDVLGKVRGANVEIPNGWVGLSDGERLEKQITELEKMKAQ